LDCNPLGFQDGKAEREDISAVDERPHVNVIKYAGEGKKNFAAGYDLNMFCLHIMYADFTVIRAVLSS